MTREQITRALELFERLVVALERRATTAEQMHELDVVAEDRDGDLEVRRTEALEQLSGVQPDQPDPPGPLELVRDKRILPVDSDPSDPA